MTGRACIALNVLLEPTEDVFPVNREPFDRECGCGLVQFGDTSSDFIPSCESARRLSRSHADYRRIRGYRLCVTDVLKLLAAGERILEIR
jgi:hypothetical protein